MIKKPPLSLRDWLRDQAIHISRIHFCLAGVFAAYIVLSDAWDLITSELIIRRWTLTASLLMFMTLFLVAARRQVTNTRYYKSILYGIILIDMFFATFAIYSQRGMASRGALLYALPIGVSAALLRLRTLVLTATACVLTYFVAALKYYDSHPNEGYLAEVYIEVGFACAIFFVLVAVLWTIIHPKKA